MQKLFFLSLMMMTYSLWGQVERIYDDNGQLKAIIPLNSDGLWHGKGLVYHPNGQIAEEIPYQKGKLHGEAIGYYQDGKLRYTAYFRHNLKEGIYSEYYPSGQVKLSQIWQDSLKHGPYRAYFENGKLRIFAWMRRDSLLFAQHYDQIGRIISEKVGYISQEIDTSFLPPPRLILQNGHSLTFQEENQVYLTQHEVPQSFIVYSSPHGTVGFSGDSKYPITLTPSAKQDYMDVFLIIRTRSSGGSRIVRKVTIPVSIP